ncbi:mediator of RNA polymerase II transcription subunit 33A-like [Herrania umbratica]|uniref:Mediator of RNA polymerase II transcription subunit 33A-like n=1 Tax=Herrania umbratica TaxID=108875 RepID=A0A6J1A3Y2_9ROSI|nr:mediator of RNA polymerase II transcription subunit 33A-like [Herrania umbratica]XP_021281711.1 mediator of RNA polymerase II transcription subunit 33A-like [Herrania umbratica]XP_021281712.1 mediator of RNA polymerase II transcription subunit 33A-like [Herrania umbratica]XP_021281713.1 mediator of RNA polymerase II transcription subunit 33A-like [Herrania umbratica]XP_021281714.1 mediator of RNA polymerase II transcription subunit 33A-like [Herrania umbratica]
MEIEKEIDRRIEWWKEQEDTTPPVWVAEMVKCIVSHGLGLPSVELGQVLISHLCFRTNQPSLWKFLQHAFCSRLLSPLHVLSLLTCRVIPFRHSQPEAYRLYVELLRRYALSFDPSIPDTCKQKIVDSVDVTLQLSQNYRVHVVGLGHAFVFFFFTIVTTLIDCILDDSGLRMTSLDEQNGAVGTRSMDHHPIDLDTGEVYHIERDKHLEQMRWKNSFLAIEALGQLTESLRAMVLLRLVYLNMPEKFNGLLQRLHFLEANQSACSSLKSTNQILARLLANIKRIPSLEYQFKKHRLIRMLVDIGSCKSVSCCNFGFGQSACWVPFDICMENAMDGKQLSVKSAIDILTETIYTLRVFNKASWKETFLALWLSALRLVQRERDPLEGPIPHLEARLCILLSIVPLAIANVFEDEAKLQSSSSQESRYEDGMGGKGCDATKSGLISALQLLGNFSGLLCPPASITAAANAAAAKVASFILKNRRDGLNSGSPIETCLNAGGNMRHLIVEACIARNLIDSSAYFWLGYVSSSMVSSELSPVKKSPWSTFMEGAPLDGHLVNSLLTTPASSLAEIEKLYHIALNGSTVEKLAAAKILCGASLSHGWNVQEHVVHFVVKLLSPPVPPGYGGPRNHLIDHMPMLCAVLFGASSIDTVHILSLHGVIPEVAASLMPLCETFGSLVATPCSQSSTGDEPSIYMVFSAAFLFLLRLWKFYKPPLELCTTGGAMGGELTLEYLLLLRNSRIASQNFAAHDDMDSNLEQLEFASNKPVYIDYFPKLRAWYCQNRSCIASTLSGLCSGNPVHEVANKILSIIYQKITKSGASQGDSSMPSSSRICGSPVSSKEDVCQIPMLSAWDVLEATPFVLEAILTACAHGRLSSRDLTTGLSDLVDFLPASLAVIISYFCAEVTRGVWKPVPMNGTDWPSPAAILPLVESEMKKILATAGVHVPNYSLGTSVMLPLPIAALVSLTITFKLNKSLEYIHAVVGPALENCASSCPWPSILIIGSLWAQKIHRWHDFIVVSCSRSVFRQNKEAVAQLLRSCFTSFLGSPHNSRLSTDQSGVNGLLGSIIAIAGVCPSIAPGFLYLRSCMTIQDVQYVNDVIVKLVAEYARESAARWTCKDTPNLRSSNSSLSFAAASAREVAMLGASLLCVSGGFQLVQELYEETILTWLLSSRGDKHGKVSSIACIVEGYAMAYLLMMSGSLAWCVGTKAPSWAISKRACAVGVHMDFLARVLEGHILLGCDPATWRAYVSCLVGLIVSCAPAWIQQVKLETLRKLVRGLIEWHEYELALSLLERGGISAIESVAELVNVIN